MKITRTSTLYVDKNTYYIVRQQSTTQTKTVLQLDITIVDESDFTLFNHHTVADSAFNSTGQLDSPD